MLIFLADDLDVLVILVGDVGDGDVLDVDLLLSDEEQQQFQRPAVYIKVDFVCGVGLGHNGGREAVPTTNMWRR